MIRKAARLAATTGALLSFFAQSIGAVNFGPMAGPGAARLAFKAANPALLPAPGAAAKAAPMPQPAPARTEARKSLVEPLPYRVHFEDALGAELVAAWRDASRRWEDFKVLVGPDPLPLKAVDLDEDVPAPRRVVLPAGAETFAAPSAPAPRPPAAAPRREPENRRVRTKAVAAAAPREAARPFQGRQPLYRVASLRRLPTLEPTPWAYPLRDSVGFAPLRRAGDPVLPRMEGRWLEGDGVRFRFIFVEPIGVSGFSAGGVSFTLADGVRVGPGERLPERYWGSYPVYRRGARVRVVVEVENTGVEALSDVEVMARQEAFEVSGGAGVPLQAGSRYLFGRLEPGQRREVKGWFQLASGSQYKGALEQTHAQVAADAGDGPTLLADETQAGIVGPPVDL